MKLKNKEKSLLSSMLVGMLFTLGNSQGYAGTMGPIVSAQGKAYVGVFGGAGENNHVGVKQFGTAFFTEAEGGPLAVNAFGTLKRGTVGLVGGHVGYQWTESVFNLMSSIAIAPAAELEGYYISKSTFTGHEINSDTTRLPEHDFLVDYPIKTGVFLVNAVANINLTSLPRFHPYVGAGIGAGLLSISHAESAQTSPPEENINHYNSSTKSSDSAFAGQVKTGLSFQLTENISIFGEYRWLYLASTDYVFGSTAYPTHAPTSSWAVKFGSQDYNMGAVGLHFSI